MQKIIIEVPVDELVKSGGDYVIHIKSSDVVSDHSSKEPMFIDYMSQVEERIKGSHSVRTQETYQIAKKSFSLYRNNIDLPISEVTPKVMEGYEKWMLTQKLKPNTTSFYMRILRAVYKRAVDEQIVVDQRPFAKVYTGNARTTKRALDAAVIRQIENYPLDDPLLQLARDLFMFSFYTRGMAFVDMAFLKKSDLRNGLLVYVRQKTGQKLTVKWDWRMQNIVDRHRAKTDVYLLPIIRRCNGKERNQYRSKQGQMNKLLHQLSTMMGLPEKLTMYVARHSWASIAQSIDIPIDIISKGMGHTSQKTTHIYLKDIDNGKIDEANARVMSMILAR